jgi:hypothetical protein
LTSNGLQIHFVVVFPKQKTEQEILVDCTTANQMWNLLTAQHRERSADNQHDLLARFYDYKYKVGASMKNHIADIKSIAHQLKEVGRPVDDREVMTKIISTLPVVYRPFVSSWRHVPLESQTLLSLTSLLMQEERENAKWTPTPASAQAGSISNESALSVQFNNAATTSGRFQSTYQDYSQNHGTGEQRTNHNAFYVQPNGPFNSYRAGNQKRGGRGRGGRGRGYQGNQIKHHGNGSDQPQLCTYCDLNNHVIEDCHQKKRHDRTDRERAEMAAKKMKMDDGQVAMVFSTTDMPLVGQDLSLVSTTPRFDTRSTGDWFADSGATSHMSDQRDWLIDFVPVPEGSWTVNGIGVSSYPVQGFGNVNVWTMVNDEKKVITLKKVLYVPGLGTNLLSIAAVTDLGWNVIFANTRVTFTAPESGLVMVGERVGSSLYLLDIHHTNEEDQVSSETCAFPSAISPGITTWHRRFAHVNYPAIIKMATNDIVKGLDLANTNIPKEPCSGCAFGKHQRSPFPTGRLRATYPGEMIHSDLCGPMENATPKGSLYYVIFIDDFSGMRFIAFLKFKSEAAGSFKDLIHKIRGETGNLVRVLRTDNGGEWSSHEFADWLNRKGIRHETTAPHTPEQDGVSERGIRTVTEGIRSCLHDDQPSSEFFGEAVTNSATNLIRESRLPTYLWAEAAQFTVYTLNRVLCKATSVTPFEAWSNNKPDVSHLRVFGCVAYVHIPKVERRKLDPKSIRCIFIGYCETRKAYRFWDPATKTVKVSRDVTFDEHHRLAGTPEEVSIITDQEICSPLVNRVEEELAVSSINDHLDQEEILQTAASNLRGETNPSEQIQATAAFPDDPISQPSVVPAVQLSAEKEERETEPKLRRSLRGRVPVKEWPVKVARIRSYADEIPIPASYREAMCSPDKDKWNVATQEEFQSLIHNGTWSAVTCPEGAKAIGSKWVYDIKPGMNDEPMRYKARLVAKGYSQRPGEDFGETHASVVTHDAFRMLMSTIAAKDLEAKQVDIKTAFLNGRLEEEIYLQQPEGFAIPGQEDKVLRLHKCIYGLRQASHVWEKLFTGYLKQQGFSQSEADPCLFTRVRGQEILYVAIWVDDGILASNRLEAIDHFLIELGHEFQIRFYPLERFVGVTIIRDREKRQIHLSQPDYIDHIVKNFHMESCNPVTVPADPNVHLVKPVQGAQLDETFPYRQAVGALLYLAVVTRPDISFAVGLVARFIEKHDTSHVNAVRRIIAYLKGTSNFGIRFVGFAADSPTGYTDADYAGCHDSRQSTTGSIFLNHGGPIAWTSRRQTCVAQSTTEAEYVAASETAKEAVWIRRALPDMHEGQDGPITIYCDNQSAIQLVHHPDQRPKTKHIDVRYHFIRLQQATGEIDMQYVNTNGQLADILTKALPGPRFATIREALGIVPALI